MKLTNGTVLITGGNSGIGLRLAEEFKKLGNTVIVTGRSEEKLKHAEQKGLRTIHSDLSSAEGILTLAETVLRKYPGINGVIHCAGIMKNENLFLGNNQKTMEETLMTNILATTLLTEKLLPTFQKNSPALIMTVTSGLAYAPLAMTPMYSASKAAIHSWTQSLRYQLRDTKIKVLELVPPYVQTGLMGARQASDPMAMPLEDFIREVMTILERGGDDLKEILVERVLPQRNSADGGREKHEEFTKTLNDRLWAARKDEFPGANA